MPMTATESTFGRKKMMRKNRQPRTRSKRQDRDDERDEDDERHRDEELRLLRKTWCTTGSVNIPM